MAENRTLHQLAIPLAHTASLTHTKPIHTRLRIPSISSLCKYHTTRKSPDTKGDGEQTATQPQLCVHHSTLQYRNYCTAHVITHSKHNPIMSSYDEWLNKSALPCKILLVKAYYFNRPPFLLYQTRTQNTTFGFRSTTRKWLITFVRQMRKWQLPQWTKYLSSS